MSIPIPIYNLIYLEKIATKSNDIHAAITAANNTFMEAFRNSDAGTLAALYTQEGQILPPNSDFVKRSPAIQGFWQAVFDMGNKAINLEIVDVEEHGNTAIEVSKFKLLDEGGQVLDEGKYIVIWKQVRGQWKLHRDIFNTSLSALGW